VRAIPRFANLCGGSPVTSPPLSRTLPFSGEINPVTTLKSVVFPAPFGPMRPSISPRLSPHEKSARAWMPSKFFESPLTSSRRIRPGTHAVATS